MYRDDREALLARAEALQKELDEAEREGAEHKDELDEANAKLKAQQKELAALRKKLAKLAPEPKPGAAARQRKTMVLAGAALAALMLAGVAMFTLMAKGDAPEVREPSVAIAVATDEPKLPACNPRELEPALEPALIDLHSCYRQYTADYRGAVRAEWVVEPSGFAGDVEVADTYPAYLRTCVSDAIIGPKFAQTDCRAQRMFVFEPTCPTEGACGLGETAPVCCAQYALPEHPPGAEVRRAIRARSRDVLRCAEHHETPESLTVTLQITPEGTLGQVSSSHSAAKISVSGGTRVDVSGGVNVTVNGESVTDSPLASIELMSCISTAMATAKFPRSREGASIEQTYSFETN